LFVILGNSGFFIVYGLYCQIIDLYDDYILACFFVVLFLGLQAIDLTKVSQELACLASDVDLVILEGMV
jgi:hypothetical protein